MEMLERLAYYGVRAVIALYIVLPVELGGPEFTQIQKGTIFAWWAFAQSMVPMYMGGLADRLGHKNTIAVAIVVKMFGYLLMAVPTGIYLSILPGDPGHVLNFYGFMAGCMLLAVGTAIFKPGLQGTLAATLNKSEASVGWAVFYQLVNVGGFLGPILAGILRGMSWQYVFFSCTVIVALNFLWLPFYRSPTEEAKAAGGVSPEAKAKQQQEMRENFGSLSQAVSLPLAIFWAIFWTITNVGLTVAQWLEFATLDVNNYALLTLMFLIFQVAFYLFIPLKGWFDEGRDDIFTVIVVSTVGIFQLRVFFFALAFAGFWLMFNQVFDLLPNVIDDWVDTSDIIGSLGVAFSTPVVPVGLGAVFAVIMAGIVAVVVLLAMRPDHHPAKQVIVPAFSVVGLAFGGALWPLLHVLANLAFQTGFLPIAEGFVPGVSLAASIVVGLAIGALWAVVRVHASIPAILAAVLALGSWGFVAISSMLGSGADLTAMADAGEQVNPEWMLNMNAGMIVFTMVFFGYLSGFVRPLTSIMIGMVVAIVGAVIAGTAMGGFVCLAGIAIFSIGEMLSSPKKMEYLATLARKGQEALFMGYANVPVAIGWIAGSIFAGNRYEEVGDKANLARHHLIEELGKSPEVVQAIPKSEVVATLAEELGMSALEAQKFLFDVYDPWQVWVEIGVIGLISLGCMVAYDVAIRIVDRKAAV